MYSGHATQGPIITQTGEGDSDQAEMSQGDRGEERPGSARLWLRLQQGDKDGGLRKVCKVAQSLGDEEGGGAVQPCADFIHEECRLGPHQRLAYAQPIFPQHLPFNTSDSRTEDSSD